MQNSSLACEKVEFGSFLVFLNISFDGDSISIKVGYQLMLSVATHMKSGMYFPNPAN